MAITLDETNVSKIRQEISLGASMLDFYKGTSESPLSAPTPQSLKSSRRAIWKGLTCQYKHACAANGTTKSCRFCRSFTPTEYYDDFIKRVYPDGVNAKYPDDEF